MAEPTRTVYALTSGALLLAGCAGVIESETFANVGTELPAPSEEAASDAPQPTGECVATPESITSIADGLTAQGVTLVDAYAVALPASYDYEYVVAAELDGPGLEGPGDIGTWATGPLGGGPIFAANDVAQQYSEWGAAANEGSPADVARDAVANSAEAVVAVACVEGRIWPMRSMARSYPIS